MSDEQPTIPPQDEPQRPAPPAQHDALIGRTMGQFQVVEEIGRGGMATVYRGLQQSMNRTVAIKVLPRTMLHDPGFYDRFVREVEVISHLEHPHILPIYDYGQEDGLPFIAMRYLGGGSLEQRVRRGVMDPDELERPLRQIAQALDYAHQQGIIHRDLKPGNIMLDESGNAYLSDFGIARVLGSDMTGSMIIGTPAYMSPEQANGLPIDGRSDVYSLGIVMFELLTGRGPFQAETPMAVLLKHITEPLPALSDLRADVPQVIEDVIRKATAKDPDERFSSAGELAEVYTLALKDAPTAAKDLRLPASRIPASSDLSEQNTALADPDDLKAEMPTGIIAEKGTHLDAVTQQGRATQTDINHAARRRTPMLIFGVVLLVLLVGAGIAFVVLSSGADGDDDATATPVVSGPPPVPTPFNRASTIGSTDGPYTITMPNEWIPPQDYIDQSQGRRLRHVWQSDRGTAYVALNIFPADLTGQERLQAAIVGFIAATVGEAGSDDLFIDAAIAEDGTERRSFRIPPQSDALPNLRTLQRPGQLDLYFRQEGDSLVVLEMYTADMYTPTLTSNDLVPQLQLILDSLRVNIGA